MSNVIEAGNVWAIFTGPNLMQAQSVLRFRQKGYTFTKAWKLGVWDGWISLIGKSGGFPAGLVPWLTARLHKEGIEVVLKDTKPEPPPSLAHIAGLTNRTTFRPHQEEAVVAGMANERGIIHQPTGSGKTEVMIELTHLIGRRCLVLVHRKDLMRQTAERFMSTLGVGKDVVGIIGDGQWEPRDITIATFQTLYLRLKARIREVEQWLREDIGQVHVDECHHLPAKSYERVMTQLKSARWRFGYSATPDKEGDLETMFKVASHLGPTIHRATGAALIDKGHLVPVDVFMVSVPPSAVPYQDWKGAVKYGIVENVTRNQMIGDIARKCAASNAGPVVILVERIAHGKRLARELGTTFVDGSSPTTVRQRAWDGLKDGSTKVLVASKVADEGLDIPPLAYLLLAGGGKAPHITLQRVGRGMRVAEGKQTLFVFDFADSGKWLGTHAKKRRKTYENESAYAVTNVDIEEVA
jgi:superfamily II DNA or RNA helicase